jgi:lysophospholipase L1-like esterase
VPTLKTTRSTWKVTTMISRDSDAWGNHVSCTSDGLWVAGMYGDDVEQQERCGTHRATSVRRRHLIAVPTRTDGSALPRGYVRFAALGDSLTHGIGDPVYDGCRGWARILAGAMSGTQEVSLSNLARPGATVADVRSSQLSDALHHRPHLASLIVGLNDTMRSTWNADQVRDDLLHVAERLAAQDVVLLTMRFHDHSRVLRLPRFLARPMLHRIEVLNEIYDEIHQRFDSVHVDLTGHPGVYDREFWSIDRLHPSELGHRALAEEFAALLEDRGLRFAGPGLDLDGLDVTRWRELRWLASAAAPWLVRRVADLAPAMASDVLKSLRRIHVSATRP